MVDTRPAVLCVVDRPGWAHDRKTEALTRALAESFRIVRRYQAEVTEDDVASADIVLLYYWLQVERIPWLEHVLRHDAKKLLIGICSHFELDGPWREPGVAMLSSLPHTVFANNRGLVETFEGVLGRRIVYTPNGVDTGVFVPASSPGSAGRFRVGWAGSLTNHGPGHRGVHEVIAPAVAAVEGAELALAAREDHWRGLEEMVGFYQSLDVYVCASRSEGTPNPCLEAAASGLPIVTTRVGNMPELIVDGENGFFFDRTVEGLASRLRRLRDDSALRRRMGAAARASVEPWDWSYRAVAYEAMFRELL